MWVIHAKLPAEAGSIVVKAIQALAKPQQETSPRDSNDRQSKPAIHGHHRSRHVRGCR
jgi:hypothetical protein